MNLNSNNPTSPFLADIVGPGATPFYIVWNLANPLAPTLIAQVQSLQYTNIANLSFLGMEGVSSTNWFTYNSSGYITGQFGDLIVYDFSSPSYPNLIGVTPTDRNRHLHIHPQAQRPRRRSIPRHRLRHHHHRHRL